MIDARDGALRADPRGFLAFHTTEPTASTVRWMSGATAPWRDQLAAIESLAHVLEQRGIDYWLFGGWAVDFWVGAVSRAHHDIDVAAWRHDYDVIRDSLVATGWKHTPEENEFAGTRFARGPAMVEFTFVFADEAGRVLIELGEGPVAWSQSSFGDFRPELLGVRCRSIPLATLRDGKATPREGEGDAAKDHADFEALSRIP